MKKFKLNLNKPFAFEIGETVTVDCKKNQTAHPKNSEIIITARKNAIYNNVYECSKTETQFFEDELKKNI